MRKIIGINRAEQIIKNETGMRFSDYVGTLRIKTQKSVLVIIMANISIIRKKGRLLLYFYAKIVKLPEKSRF